MSEFEPKIVAFVCNWCTYAGADLTGTSRIKYPSNVRMIRLPCTGCQLCVKACPYQAIEMEEIKDRKGNVVKVAAKVNPGLCQGCGTCVALCRVKAIDLQGFSNEQVYAELCAL